MENTTEIQPNVISVNPKENQAVGAVKLVLYAIIFVSSVTGNVLVCLVVCRQQKLRTSTNFYIMNLALADLAITVLCIPVDLTVQVNGYAWPFGEELCHIIYPIMTMCAFASVSTLTAIAYNRYMAISRPMRVHAGRKRAKLTILVIWLTCFIFVLPYTLILTTKDSQCVETWSKLHSQIYTVFIFVFQYVLPLSVISFAYVRIGIQLRRNRKHLTAAHRVQDRDVAKVVRMMTIVVLIFAFCMLPNHILWLLRDFSATFPEDGRKLLGWGELLIYANSCTNPIVYGICIEEFRLAFKAYITKCCRVTDEDILPASRLLERVSTRHRSFSSDKIFARQLSRRLRISLQRSQSVISRGSLAKFLHSSESRTAMKGTNSPQPMDKTHGSRNLIQDQIPPDMNGNGCAFAVTTV